MKKLFLVLGLMMAVVIAAPVHAGGKDDAMKAIAEAKKSAKKAGKVGYQWRDTGKFIKKAEAAMKKKDYSKAVKLAKKANAEGKLAYNQYMKEMKGKK